MPEPTEHVSGGAARAPALDGVELLSRQHDEVRSLIGRLREAEGEDCKQLVNELSDKLIVHAKLEEKFFYPALREACPDEVRQALADHHAVDELLDGLEGLSYLSPGFDEKLQSLLGDVEDHLEVEEDTLFPQARSLSSLDDMGADMRDEMPRIDPAHIRNEWQRTGRIH